MTKKALFLSILFFILMSISSYNLPIFETTDARYSEIAREMLRSGNYLESTLNGIKHFHKPPLAYWLIAAGIKIFGLNGLGPRFFGILFAFFTLIITYYTALLITQEKKYAENSVFILASSFLFIGVSNVISTDIYLTFFTTASFYFIFSYRYTKKTINLFIIGLITSLGFLTKGPVIFLFTFLPYLIISLLSKEERIFTTKQLLLIFIVFLIFGLPWYIIVSIKNNDLISYFLKVQTAERVLTSKFHRNKPFYFFIIVFILSFYPYSIAYIKKLYDDLKIQSKETFNHIYIIFPLVFFSLSKSKLATYILPFYPFLSIILSEKINNLFTEKTVKYTIYLFFIAASIFLFIPIKFFKFKSMFYIFALISFFSTYSYT